MYYKDPEKGRKASERPVNAAFDDIHTIRAYSAGYPFDEYACTSAGFLVRCAAHAYSDSAGSVQLLM